MRKSSKARLFSTCLTGAVLAAAMPAWAQTSDAPTWKPRAEVEAQAGKDIGVSTSLFAPVAQNDSGLVYVDGRIGYDQRFDRNGSATVGARFRTGEDIAIGVNVGADFYRSDIGSRDQAALSMGLEGFSSVFDVRVNYRLPLSKTQTIGFIDPNSVTGSGALVLENNRLIERRSGFRLEAIPLQGFNGEAGVRLPVGGNASIRGSVGGFDYWDRKADENYRGIRGGLELDIEDKDSGTRFTFGGVVEHDNRFGTDARAHVRLSIPFGGRAGDRGASPTGLDRQMGDRVRRDYVARSGSRYTDLTTSRFAVDARTGNEFGGFFYANGAGVTGAAGTLASPTTLSDAVTRAGTNGVVVALGNAGNISTSGVTLATDQYLLGGAGAVDVRLIDGSTTQFALGGTNGVIVGTSAPTAAVTLGQGSVVRDVTVRGAGVGIAANGVGGFALDRVTIENTGGAGLSLTNTLGTVSLTGLTIRGGAGAGVLVNGGGSVSIANSTISGGTGAIDINDGGANLTASLSNLTLSATGGNVLDIDGSGAGTVTVTGLSGVMIQGGNGETGGLSVRSATFDANTATAGIQAVNAGRMEVGTAAARVNGQGVFLTDVTGSLSFADLDIANSGATGLRVVNSKVNSFTLATLDGTIDTVGGTAVDLDPLVINLNFASVSSVGAGGPGVILDTVEGGGTGGNALTIGTLTISNSGGDGLVILNSTGLVRVNGGAITNSGGSSVRIGEQGVAGSGGSAGLIFAGSITDAAGASPIVAIFSTGGTINFTGPITGSGGIVVQDTLAGSAISFGAISLTGTVGDAITLNGLAGSINFAGLVTIANPGANGIVIGSVPGGVTFADVDITGLGNFNGLDVRGTQGTVLFNSLDITGTGTGTGINVTGSTNSGNVMILGPSVIQGVNIGVDLTQANMTGQFRFGDGNATPMNSTISANIPIVIALMNGTNGSYDFADANLVGDTSNLTGAGFTAYYARVGATGAGTRNDPGSLAGADASNAQYIVLLNDPTGGQDVFDAADAGGSFDLAAGQSLVSFLNGDFFAVSGASLPANLTVSGLGPSGITNVYAGSGGAVLTTSTAGTATVNLASNSTIDGLVIRNAGGDVGVEGSGVSNVRIQNSDIAGATGAIAISDGGTTSSVQLTHLDLASTAGTTLALSGAGAGTLTVSASDVDIAATGTSAALSLVDLASGGIGFGAVSTGSSAGGALAVQGVTGGAVTIGSVAVGGSGAGTGITIGGNSAAVTVGAITIGSSAGAALQIAGNSGAVTLGAVSVGNSGGDAVQVVGNNGAVTVGAISAVGSGGDGVELNGNSGAVTLGALWFSGAVGAGLNIQDALGNVTVAGASISGGGAGVAIDGVAAGRSVTIGSIAVSGSGSGVTLADVDGSVMVSGATLIANPGTAGIVIGAGSTGSITFGDVDIMGLSAGTTGVDARAASGTISFNTLDIAGSSTTGTRGIDLTGATFAGSFATVDSGSITGVGVGVDLTNAAITGSFRYGDGSNTDADGAASSINAVVPIVITGINVGTGSYNFLDVALTGDTSTLTSSSTLYFVRAGATGVGTMADPGSLAGAEASSADTIILLNDPTGGQDMLDAAGAGGSFDLAAGRQLLSFLNGDTIMLPGGAPANLLLYGVPQGQVGNPYAGSGAPVLTTTTAGANTVVLGGSNTIDGVIIGTAGAGGGIGVFGSGVANVVIRNSTISGSGGAIQLIDNGAAASAALSNLLLSSSGGVVLDLDGGGAGTLAITAFDDIAIAGGNGELGGLFVTDVLFDADLATAGAQAVVGALTIGSAGARVDGFGVDIVADGSLDFTSLSVFNANGVGVSLVGNTDLTALVRAGSIGTDGDEALVAQNAALALNFGSITAVDGGILMFANTAADAAQPALNVGSLSLTDGGLALIGSGDYVFANASITDNVGMAVLLGDAVNLDYAGDITSGPASNVTVGVISHTGTVSFHDGTIDATGGAGLQFIDADGTYSFIGTTTLHGGDAGIHVAFDSSGSFLFGAGTSVTDGAVANFMLEQSDANVTYLGSLSQGLNTDNFVVDGQTGGTLDFSQATISATAGSGVLFNNADGTTMLGDVQLSGGAVISVITDSDGSISFGDVDIGIGANQTAVSLTGALGNVTFQTLDITGTSAVGSKGIDLTGSTTAANIIVSESSTITGVGVGVDLTNAAITGNFRYGDGSNTDADGAASTISASVPIEITGINGAVGTYDFADVNLIGDTSRLVTSATTYFVAAGATGVGTMADPGSLADAELSGAQIIVLLNDPAGGQDVLDAASAGGSFDLGAGQSLLGFLNGDTITLPAGGPGNLVLFGITPGQLVNPFTGSGAPVLTTTAATTTLVLGADTVVDGIVIDAPNGIGIIGQYANTTIRNSTISAGSNAILIVDAAADTSVSLSNLLLSSASGAVLNLDGTNAGTLTVTALDDITILGGNGETAGLSGDSVVFDSDLVTAGFQAVSGALNIGTTAARVGGVGLYLTQAEGDLGLDLDLASVDTGADVTGTGGFRFATSGGTIDVSSGIAYGLFLRDLSADVVLSSLIYSGTGNAVGTQNVAGFGPAGRALDIGGLSVANGAANAITMTGSATGSFSFGAGSSIGTTTGAAILLSNSGASTLNYSGAINYAGIDAALSVSGGHAGTVNLSGTANVTSGTGLVFQDADGAYNFTGTASLATGVSVTGGSAGSFTFGAGTTITNPAGVAIDIQNSTASLNYAGAISYDVGASAAVNIVNHSGGTVSFTGLLDVTFGTGLNFDNADGTYNFVGTTDLDAGNAGIVIANGSGGSFTFGADTTVITTGGSVLAVSASTASIDYLGYANAFGGNGISVVDHATGTIDFTGATLTLNGATTVYFDNADGTYAFGSFAMTSGATIEIVNGAAGSFGFGDVDMAGIGAGQTAVNLTGATGNVTFQTLDITGTGGTGIDLTGSTTAANIIINESSAISGVGIGIDLTNAAITGTFRYGDGSNTDADGAASSISAVTPLAIGGLNAGVGTYDFADVVLTGDTSALSTNRTIFWVQAGATGAGTRADPGSLAAAEASGVDVIILLDTQIGAGQDVIDAASAGGSLDLGVNQSLLSFLGGDTLSVGGGAPANLLLFGIAGGSVTNPYAGSGAALLTTSQAGAATVNLASGVLIDGVQIGNLDWKGVLGAGVTGLTIRNSIVHGGVNAIQIIDNGGAASVALSNLTLSSDTGDVLSLLGNGGGQLAVTQLSGITILGGNSGAGLYSEDVIFDADLATAGIETVVGALDIGTSASRIGGSGLVLDGATGGLSLATTVFNANGDGIFADGGAGFTLAITGGTIDTGPVAASGSALDLSNLAADVQLTSITYTGVDSGVLANNVTGVGTGGRALDIATLTVASGAARGVFLSGTTNGNFSFGSGSSITGTTVSAIALANSGAGSFSYDGSITGATGTLVTASGGDIGSATFSGTLSATGGTGLQFDNADGTYSFTGTTTLNGGDAGIDILNGSAGSFTFGTGTSITSPSGVGINIADSTAVLTYNGSLSYATAAQAAVNVANHSGGTILFQTGTLNITNGTGLQFDNAGSTYNFTGTTTLNGGDAGIDIVNGSGGSFDFGSGTSITGPSGTGLGIQNSTANVTYSGSLTYASAGNAAIGILSHSGGTLDFQAATFAITGGTGISFDNADGTYTFGSLALSGGAGIVVLNGSAGTFTLGDVDITGLGANQTAVNLTGATGNMTFNTLDITGTSAVGSKGIDLTGNTGTGNIVVTNSSTITGVGIGVDLTNASRPGLFQYGDGVNPTAASTISATTPIVITGLVATGTYDFEDVNLVGNTTQLSVNAYFVSATGTGDGSPTNPGNLGTIPVGVDYIVLVDTQAGAGSFDTISGTITLAAGQSLLSFRNGDTFNVGGGAPANVLLYNITTGNITNPNAGTGAPLLDSGSATGTVVLGGNNIVDGVVVSNSGTGAGVYASGVTGSFTIRNSTVSNTGTGAGIYASGAAGSFVISNSTISGGGAAINLLSGAATLDVNFANLTLANSGGATGALLDLNGTGGTLTVTGMSNLSIVTSGGETDGLVFDTVTFDSDLATAGIQAVNAGAITIGTSGARVQGDGLSLTNVSGALTFDDLDIANNGGTGLLVANSKANSFLLTTLDGSYDTTNGTAINLDPLTVNITAASVSASGGAHGILLDQVLGSFTVTGAVNVSGATTAGIAIQDNTALTAAFNGAVTINNTSGTGLSLTNNNGATISFAGGGTGVDVVTTSGAGLVASGGGAITFAGSGNSIQTGTGQIVNFNGVTADAGGISFASLGSSSTVANTAILINNLDGGAFSGGTVSIAGTSGATSDGIWIGGGSSSTMSFGATTMAGLGDEGIEINGAGNGAISFTSVVIDNTASDGILITGSDGTVTISGGDIGNLNDPSTIGVNIDGGVGAITIDAGILKTTAGRAVQVTNRTGGSVSFGGFISSGGAASGWSIMGNSGGTITFSGAGNTINGGATIGVELLNNSGSTINFTGGGLAITSSTSGIFAQGGGTLNITGSGNTISANGTEVIVLDGMTVGASGINFSTVSATNVATGIALTNVGSAGGAITLGTVNLQGVLTRGIDVTGTLGAALTIGDLDIGLNSTTAVAFDLNGAALSAAITAGDFDVTNAGAPGTSIAVDLRGTTGAQILQLGDTAVAGGSASITGVGTGVYLNAATNAAFTFGDGESATDGTSSISATTGINAAAAPVAGSYNFRDVTFSASPGLGFGVGRTLFVDSNGATGGGNGSGADGANPMTLAAAELILAATDVIVLVNNGSAISAAGSNGDDTLNLLSDAQVRGFGQGPLALTLTVPSTIQLSGTTININDPTGNGAATLTSAAGANVITLGASGNHISGFILDGDPAGALRGIVDNGGASGTVIDFMTIRNFDAVGGYGIEITPSTNTTIDNVTFTGNTNDVLLNAAGSTITNVTATGATGTSITLNNATGTTTLTNLAISGAATGMAFATPGGTINATNVDISGAATSALTVTDGTASFNFDATSSITQAAGGLTLNVAGNHTTGTFAFAGTIDATSGNGMQFSNADGTYNFTGTTTFNGGNAGIDIYNGATGTFAFGSGTTLTHNGAGNAFVLLSSANVTFDGAITDNNGVAVEIDGHDAGIATFNGAISSSIGNASTVVSIVNSNGGAIDFNGQMTIASTAAVVSLSSNAGSTITFNAGGTGLDITSTTGTGMLITGGGTVNVQGSGNSITTTSGTLLSVTNTGATATAVDLSFASVDNTSGANGIFVQRTAGTLGGTVNIATGTIAASTRGISLAGDALDFTFGGAITALGGRSFEATGRTAGTVTLSGPIDDAFNGINIATNSGGTITLSGNLNAAGVGATGALTVSGNTGGTINFTGGTKRFNTGAATALNLASNSGTTINFTNGGLAVTTSSGAGLNATGGGTIAVTGANNTIQTATGQIVNLNAVSGGTGGIGFASLASSGMVSGTAISFNNFDGTSFTVTGATNIAGGTGAGTDDGIFIGNNSAATVTFGATTITGSIGDDGIEVNGAGNGAVTFASVTIDNTLGHGVEINGSTGTVSINGGSIGATNDPASNGVLVTGGSGTVTIASSIAKTTAGSVVSVTGRTGGTVTLSGNITASGAVNNGISVASNTGGTVNFTGQTISLTTGANTGVNLATNSGATISFAPAGGGNGLDIVTTSGTGFSATGGGTVTVSGSGNTIQTATGQVINLTGVSAGSGGVNFATLTSTGVVSGIALNFSNFDSSGGGAFSGGTISVAGASSDGIFIGAGSAANLSFGATTIGTGANAVSGDGIEINGSGNGAVSFSSVDIDNTTAHGVNITGAAGTTGTIAISGGSIGAGGAGSIDGDGVNITGGGDGITIAASITKTNAGNVVEVSSHTAGAVIFSGNLSATGGVANGILLSNNSGGTIAFSGASKTINTGANNAIQMSNTAGTGAAVSFTGGNLDVDTTTGNGITTSSTTAGAGSLVITGTNNTIASAGGIALNVVNTNIAAGGLNFLSIAANGGSRGIVLNTTGSTAGLTITGSGTDGSGGTIQNITARGIELLSTAAVNISNLNLTNASTTGQAAGQDLDLTTANGAIYMSGVSTAVFDNINITGTIADNGITGINVSNFQLNNSFITTAGDGANESGIEFSNLSGTSSLTNTEIAFSETNSLDIVNTDVNLNLTLNNVIFRDTQSSTTNGEGGLQFRSFSSAAGTPTTNIDIVDSDFLRLRTQGIQVVGEDDSVVSVDIVNNVIQSQADIGVGVDINGNDTATVTFNVNSNTIQSQGGHSVNITSFLDSNVMGRINGNTITANGSGAGGSGVRAVAQETSQIIIDVSNNSITAGAGNTSNMIDMQARFDTARLDATINNNNIDSDAGALADINITAGSSLAGETNQVYVNILNNDIAAGGPTNMLRLRVSDLASATRLFLTGFTEGGAGIEDDAVATWNNNTNTPLATTSNIAVSLTGTAVGPVAGTAQTPTNPAP